MRPTILVEINGASRLWFGGRWHNFTNEGSAKKWCFDRKLKYNVIRSDA